MTTKKKYCIPARRRNVHVLFETIAVVGVAPWIYYLSRQKRPLTLAERRSLAALAAATLAVDGWLLWQYSQAR